MRPSRSLSLTAPLLIAALLLAGCVPTDEPDTDPNAGETSTPSPTAGETTTPTATPTAEPATPVTISCEQLLPADAMYAFDPNFSLQPSFTPAAGSLAAQALADDGIACQWVHQTSGVTIELSAAQPSPKALNDRMNDLVMTSNSVPTYQVEGYFQLKGSSGEAEAFPLPFWVSAVSPAFFEPGDAAPIVAAMVDALT
jgi:hypothetical protein